MSSLIPKSFYIGTPANAVVYTSGTNVGDYSIIKVINICNSNTSSSKSASIHILTPTNNTAQPNNLMISNIIIPPNDVVQIGTSIVLDTNSSIHANHNGNITFIISGVEYK